MGENHAFSTLLAPIAKHRVTRKQPTRDQDELDVERCAAMHNTLVLYGWIFSGKKVPDMQKKSWWSKHGSQSLERIVRPAVKRYLSKIFDVTTQHFFYHVSGLARPPEMLLLGQLLEDPDRDPANAEKYRFLILYTTSKALVKNPAGIVYDQQRNLAILMPTYNHVFDLRSPALPWQRLETVLSAYVDMIEGEKAVAVPDTIPVGEPISTPTMRDGIGTQVRFSTRPWALQPYTLGDLTACLDTWKHLVQAIEKRTGAPPRDAEADPAPLCTKAALGVAGVPKGFAFDLLMRAQNSPIWFIAPGIRLPKVEEFVHQPFKEVQKRFPAETDGMKSPFLFLRCPGTVSAKEAGFRWPFSTVESVPCGLYLDAFPNAQNPFEDACRLVLPIRLGGNRFAKTSDSRPIRRGHSDLYQIEINPFVPRHGPKLVAVLESWLENVESGHWGVNEKGVTGGIGLWRQADTKEDWWRYQSKHLSI